MVVGLFAELGNLVANVSSPIEGTSSMRSCAWRWVCGCAQPHALMMSPRLVMKRLQPNCPAQRTSQRPSTLPELPTFSSIENKGYFLYDTLLIGPQERWCIGLIWFFERLTWNPAESLVCDVLRQLNVPHQAASCLSRYDIQDIATHPSLAIYLKTSCHHTGRHHQCADSDDVFLTADETFARQLPSLANRSTAT
ncbi:hypothetical protein T265_00933 [Opisthorchis viverrini]|uniref:Uncharacterized protein n=1 Tax=Opisthorchis viverrini TaxID=6198 RepID=A0A075A0M8_OPIVI|nr:hypothetical protein T265_00933 [Opisthorchis viverrini]KER33248.1 hypothetical protein T265_00933 [Opisthorchis viverrini]